jgi:hypothetical protein
VGLEEAIISIGFIVGVHLIREIILGLDYFEVVDANLEKHEHSCRIIDSKDYN